MCLSVNNCCCYFTLSAGTKVISILNTVSALALLLLFGSSALLVPDLPPGRLVFYSAVAVTSFLQCVFGCIFIYGAFARKPKLLVPWVALAWAQAAVLAVLAAAGAVLLGSGRPETTAAISSAISLYFIYALILYYCASVVYSRRQQMLVEGRAETAKRLMRHRLLPNYYV